MRLAASQFSVTFQHQGSVCRRGIKARGGKNEVSDILTRQGTLLTMMILIMTIVMMMMMMMMTRLPIFSSDGDRREKPRCDRVSLRQDSTTCSASRHIQWVSSAQCIVKYVAKYSALVSSGLCSV